MAENEIPKEPDSSAKVDPEAAHVQLLEYIESVKPRRGPGTETISEFFENLSNLGDPLPQLWRDALQFMREGKNHIGRDETIAQGFLRGSVFMAAAAFEGYVNYLAEKVVQEGEVHGLKLKLSQFEVDCLRERRRVLKNGEVKDVRQIYSTRERFLLLGKILWFGRGLPTQEMAKLDASIKVRDMLVHPKPGNLCHLDEEAAMGYFRAAMWLSVVWTTMELVSTFVKNHAGRESLGQKPAG